MNRRYILTIMLLMVLATCSMSASASCPCTTIDTDTINGSIYYKSCSSWPGDGGTGHYYKTCTFTDVPAGVKIARVHTGIWMLGNGGTVNITVNGASSGAVTAGACPNCNAINTPKMHDYCTGSGVGFITYNATANVPSGGGDVTVKVESFSTADDGRIYTIALLVVYENASMNSMTYWINEGARFSPTTTGFAGPYSEADVTDGTYWTLGVPHGIDDGNGNAFLNSNDIGHWDYHEGSSYYDLYRWDDINLNHLNEPNDQMSHPVASEYDRLSAAVFMLERGGGGDTIPPASVTNLQNITYEQTHVNWTWTDPGNADFSYVMVHLNNVPKPNVTKGVQYYNATGLVHNTEYTISTRTVDINGTINSTWVNQTAETKGSSDATPPTLTFVPPTPANNSEVTVNYVFVNVTLNESGNTVLLNWNGSNETMFGSGMNFYLNKAGLSNEIYTFKVYANDTSDNWNVSETRIVTINATQTSTPPVEVPAITPPSFLLALLSLLGLGAVVMKRM